MVTVPRMTQHMPQLTDTNYLQIFYRLLLHLLQALGVQIKSKCSLMLAYVVLQKETNLYAKTMN